MAAPANSLVALLYADLVGATAAWERDPTAAREAHVRADARLRDPVAAHGGEVIPAPINAWAAAFPAPAPAIAAALQAQRAAAEGDGRPVLRIAVVAGAGEAAAPPPLLLERARRVAEAGHAGQVLLNALAADLVGDALPAGVGLRDLGERRLPDLARPECIALLTAPGLPSRFPPYQSLNRRPHNLPAPMTALVGREAELAGVEGLLRRDGVRLVTLLGPGGVGKTRLASEVGWGLLDEQADGAWFVELAEVADPEPAVAEVAQVLGVREEPDRPLRATVLGHLRDKQTLLVLDNLEQVPGIAPFVAELLGVCPGVRVLATSRVPLRVQWERQVPVEPLDLPDPQRLPSPERLAETEAVRLFVERAHAVWPAFAVTAGNAQAVAAVCRRLDGLPLAIELAAPWLRILTPQQMLARLEGGKGLPAGGRPDVAARHHSLQAVLAWSYDLLSSDERALYRRVSVFAGGCTVEAAEAVGPAAGALSVPVLDGLQALVEASLLRQADQDGEPRLAMLQTVREFGLERLEDSGEGAATRRAHAEHYLALAERAALELTGPDQAPWLDRLAAEHDNLRAALRWCAEEGEVEQGLRLAGALWRFWAVRGHLSEGRQWLERALAQADGASAAVLAKALQGAGGLAHYQGDYDRARELHERELAEYRAIGDQKGVGEALINLGASVMFQGDHVQATDLLGQALALFQGMGDRFNESLALNWLGAVAFLGGEYDRATALYEESLALSRQLENKQEIAFALANLAEARQHQGDLERAQALYHQVLPLFRELGDTQHAAFALHGLGVAALTRGDVTDARGFLQESLAISHEVGNKPAVVRSLEQLAQAAVAQGDFARAARVFGAADALREGIGAPLAEAYAVEHDRDVGRAREALGAAAFADAWEAGRALTREAAVAEALEGGEGRATETPP